MNLRMKRCVIGLMTWAALTGVAVSQPPQATEGVVRFGAKQNPEVVQPAAMQGGDAQGDNAPPISSEGRIQVGSPPAADGSQTPIPPQLPPQQLPPPLPPVSANPGGLMGYTPVNRMFQPRYNVNSYGGGLYGYNAGYATVGAFVPFAIESDEAILFVDARGLVTYDGQGGGNLGAGWRWWMSEFDRIIGLNAFYDNTSGGIGGNFSQMGVGFESLGRYVDYRINGYIPAGQHDRIGASTFGSTPLFSGSSLGFLQTTQIAQAFTGFDIETGGPLPILGRYGFNGYLGGYHFMGAGTTGGSFTGISGRWLAQINEDVQFGMQMTSDHTFGLNTQFQVFVTLPDGAPSRWMRNKRVQDRLTQQVFRQYRAITHTQAVTSLDKAIDPATNKPYFVAFINPNAATTGNGTVETPFKSIGAYNALSPAQQQKYDMLYVSPGTAPTLTTPGTLTNLDTTSTLTLYSNQRLFSTSVAHSFDATNFPGQQFALPGFVSGSATPALFNSSGGNVVTLASNSQNIEISGFGITGSATGNGIAGSNIRDLLVNHNTIQSGLNGVALTNLSGTVAGLSSAQIIDNTFQNNVNSGFQVVNTGAQQLDVVIQGNTATGNGGDGFHFEANGGSVIGGLIGGQDTATAGTTTGLHGNTFSSNGGNGLTLLANAGTLNFGAEGGTAGNGIINNSFLSNTGSGAYISMSNSSVGDFDVQTNKFGTLIVGTTSNTGNGSGGDGLHIEADSGSVAEGLIGGQNTATTPVVLNGNTFASNLGNGLSLVANDGTLNFGAAGGTAGIGIINNSFLANTGNGLNISTTNSSFGSFDIYSNKFGDTTIASSGNTGYGINLASDSGANSINIGGPTPTIGAALGNLFTGNVSGAVNYNLTGTNITQSNIQNNTVTFNAVSGGSAIVSGFNQNNLPANDDGSTGLVPIGFNADFFGVNFNQVYVNNNGNVTLTQPLATFTPFPIVTNGIAMLAPFFADVDTRSGNIVTYGSGTVNGHLAWGVNWPDVRHFSAAGGGNNGLPTNNFQLVIIDRSDIAPGDFDFEFNYKQIVWEAGQASGSNAQGLGGTSARVGWTNGSTNSFELPGSAVNGALLDTGPAATSLIHNSLNSPIIGRYFFSVRGGIVTTGEPGNQNGFTINVSDTAHLETSNISQNNVGGVGGYGLQINTHNNGLVDNLTVTGNTFSQNDGGIQLNRTDSSLIQATLTSNLMNQNNFTGLSINSSGTNVNGVFLTSNLDSYLKNGTDNINVTTAGTSTTTFDLTNALLNNGGGNGFSVTTSGGSTFNSSITSPTDPLFTAAARSSVSNNGQNGFLLTANDTSHLNMTVNNTDVNNNGADGFSGSRGSTGAFNLSITGSSVNTNGVDGLQLAMGGNNPPNSFLNLNTTTFNNNVAGDGLDISMGGASVLQSSIISSTFNGNGLNGISVVTAASSSFGTLTNAATFNGVSASGNKGGSGMLFQTSNTDPVGSSLLANIFSLAGNTTISSNSGDGVTVNGGGLLTNVQISADGVAGLTSGFTTTINSNQKNGVNFTASDSRNHVVSVQDATINSNLQAGVRMLVTDSTNLGGPDSGNGTLILGTAGFGNSISSNTGDGVRVILADTNGPAVASLTATDNTIQSNTGDGLHAIMAGTPAGTGAGVGTLNINATNNSINQNKGNGVDLVGIGNQGFSAAAGTMLTSFTGNTIDANSLNGVNISLLGDIGGSRATPNQFQFIGNRISSNLQDGLTYRSDSGNAGFVSQSFFPSGTARLLLNYETATNSNLVMYKNQVDNNGTVGSAVAGVGVALNVGTATYLSADMGGAVGSGNGNTFGGNIAAIDLLTTSFVSNNGAQPPASIRGNNPPPGVAAPDIIFAYNTAQLDLRFHNNTGNAIAPSLFSSQQADYGPSNDPTGLRLSSGVVQLFQVDGPAGALSAPDNVFTKDNGATFQNIDAAFTQGLFHIRAASDPLFPNPAFPPFLP